MDEAASGLPELVFEGAMILGAGLGISAFAAIAALVALARK
jgi:hypothetical protein